MKGQKMGQLCFSHLHKLGRAGERGGKVKRQTGQPGCAPLCAWPTQASFTMLYFACSRNLAVYVDRLMLDKLTPEMQPPVK